MTASIFSSSLAQAQAFPKEDSECLPFDGVVCFGGVDWWYHNRGHYDLQMMREFSKRVPVLYVNSIGMRRPSLGEGRVFFQRLARKGRSLARGLRKVAPRFHVFSPLTFPGEGRAASLVRKTLPGQVAWAARRCGIRKPLVWVACSPAVEALNALSPERLIYQRTDRFESFSGVDADAIRAFDVQLKARADLVLFCANRLYAEEAGACRDALFLDHGVDYDLFRSAAEDNVRGRQEPRDISDIPRPRIGFIGGIDSHTFDAKFFRKVADLCPDKNFVLVGGCSLPKQWCDKSNVHLLGRKPYGQVAAYMAACDVLIMPWNQNRWIEYCNPVKLKEYMAVGRPIVSTPFPELTHYAELTRAADSPEAFSKAISESLEAPFDPEAQRRRVREHTWSRQADRLWARLVAGRPRTAGKSCLVECRYAQI